jgi:lysyl endopeptidase
MRTGTSGIGLALLLAFGPAATARADDRPIPVVELGPAVFHSAAPRRAPATRADLVMAPSRIPGGARHDFGPLSSRERGELKAPDRRGKIRRKLPAVKIGITRNLPEPVGFAGLPGELEPGGERVFAGGFLERRADGGFAWTAVFSSPGARGLRLYIPAALLPPGSRVYVYGGSEIHGPYDFTSGTRPEGFWTNTVFASQISLEVQVPDAAPAELARATLRIASVVHLESPGLSSPAVGGASVPPRASQTCFVDATCIDAAEFASITQARRAISQLTFVDTGLAYGCTGGLMNSTDGLFIPYVLTANHCFSTQAAATSLEAYWQYETATCNGPDPDENLFPRTLGSTLLSTGETSDFTLVQLSQAPPNDSVFLGWTTDDYSQAAGTTLYRLSHPIDLTTLLPRPQYYTEERISATPTPVSCTDAPQGNFIYEKDVVGGTGGGSSGSPAYLEDLKVVGQELGGCGTNVDDDCDVTANSTVDGAFRVTFPSVQQWLSPGTPATCTPNATTLCLNGGRFQVTTNYATAAGQSGAGMAVSLTSDSGYFWFFNSANIELVVKVLDACGLNPPHFWVFAGGLTNVQVTLDVLDTQTGAEKTYVNPLGTAFAPIQDTSAFSCP